jgi:hypothetical protein
MGSQVKSLVLSVPCYEWWIPSWSQIIVLTFARPQYRFGICQFLFEVPMEVCLVLEYILKYSTVRYSTDLSEHFIEWWTPVPGTHFCYTFSYSIVEYYRTSSDQN